MSETEKGFEEWAVVELFGRQKIAGRVTEQVIGGQGFIRVDVPAGEDQLAMTRFYGPNAIYCLTPVTEAVARAAARCFAPAPVALWELRPPLPAPGGEDLDNDDEEPGARHGTHVVIWHPKPGQRVEIRYRKNLRLVMAHHGRRGVVQKVAGGRGPLNVEVLLDPPEAGIRVAVPRGNLVAVKDKDAHDSSH